MDLLGNLAIRRETARDRVTGALRAAIIAGTMRPGDVFSAPELAARFGVSPTPVREGMLDLVKDGLVVALPNKGFRVTEVSDQDLDDVSDLRQIIEAVGFIRSAPLLAEEELDRLEGIGAQIVETASVGDLEAYLAADLEFHLLLLSHSGNRKLIEIVTSLRAQTRLYGLSRLAEEGKLTGSATEHLELVSLVRAGDFEQAVALLHQHIGHSRGIWSEERS